MSIKNKIKELEIELAHLKAEPGVNWLGKWAKSIQAKRIEKKIAELKKEMKPNHHSKHKLNPDVE